MKDLNLYITEKLHLNSNSEQYKLSIDNLVGIIGEKYDYAGILW